MGSFFAWRPKINFLCPFNNRKGRNIACTLASTDLTSWPAESTFQNMIEATKRIGGLSFGDILKHPRCAASSEGIYLLLEFLFNKFWGLRIRLNTFVPNSSTPVLIFTLFIISPSFLRLTNIMELHKRKIEDSCIRNIEAVHITNCAAASWIM